MRGAVAKNLDRFDPETRQSLDKARQSLISAWDSCPVDTLPSLSMDAENKLRSIIRPSHNDVHHDT